VSENAVVEHINRQIPLAQLISMEFMTVSEWKGGYPAKLSCQNGAVVEYSPPIEFGGMKGPLSPEDAFVGAANMCYQIVFLGIARNLGTEILDYRCRAVGKLETVNGVRRFTGIELSPEIRVAPGTEIATVEKALDATKSRCLVTNSMDVTISISASISD
jgi:organic hydroperoxide reductase OsmC/OhrA